MHAKQIRYSPQSCHPRGRARIGSSLRPDAVVLFPLHSTDSSLAFRSVTVLHRWLRRLERICGHSFVVFAPRGQPPNNPVGIGSSFRLLHSAAYLRRSSSALRTAFVICSRTQWLHPMWTHPIHLPDRHEMIVPVLLFSDHPAHADLNSAIRPWARSTIAPPVIASISAGLLPKVCKLSDFFSRSTEANAAFVG